MQQGRQILNPDRFKITLLRLAHELIENYSKEEAINIIGIQEKGVILGERLMELLRMKLPRTKINFGKLDITFYRDDFRLRSTPLTANATSIGFDIEDKKIILIDDVLYTGRTIHAAISAIQDFGRVRQIELLTMVDRRLNRHLPIKADYFGVQVDSVDDAYVHVQWEQIEGKDKIMIYSANTIRNNERR